MIRKIHCWWCGQQAEVDTELPESAGMVRDTDTSWLCADNDACNQRALDAWNRGGKRNKGKPVAQEASGLPPEGEQT